MMVMRSSDMDVLIDVYNVGRLIHDGLQRIATLEDIQQIQTPNFGAPLKPLCQR